MRNECNFFYINHKLIQCCIMLNLYNFVWNYIKATIQSTLLFQHFVILQNRILLSLLLFNRFSDSAKFQLLYLALCLCILMYKTTNLFVCTSREDEDLSEFSRENIKILQVSGSKISFYVLIENLSKFKSFKSQL